MRVLVFGGTSEGVSLARLLPGPGRSVTVSVATDYGAALLAGLPVSVRIGRLNEEEMAALMADYDAVVDATHPYAEAVSAAVRAAAARCRLPCLRLLRPDTTEPWDWTEVPDADAAVRLLEQMPGRILLTTGSKDLPRFTALSDYRERLWVRILPSEDSLRRALALGIPPRNLIAMQGPFSEELNLALLRQFDLRILVTKRSGAAGGFGEKLRAARRAGAVVVVLARPQEEGMSLTQVLHWFGLETE